jgi:hypothetical protein
MYASTKATAPVYVPHRRATGPTKPVYSDLQSALVLGHRGHRHLALFASYRYRSPWPSGRPKTLRLNLSLRSAPRARGGKRRPIPIHEMTRSGSSVSASTSAASSRAATPTARPNAEVGPKDLEKWKAWLNTNVPGSVKHISILHRLLPCRCLDTGRF